MSEQFKREIRYDVIKLKTGEKVTCVVVEEDWPEYEIVWQMLQDRMEGRPNKITQLESQLTAEREARQRAEEDVKKFMALSKANEQLAEIAKRQAVPEGWKLVPIEPKE